MENLSVISEVKLVYKRAIEFSKMPKVLDSKDVYNILKDCFDPETIDLKLTCKVMLLSRSQSVIGILTVSEGGTVECPVDVKCIMQGAILGNANKIILAHNIPSGNLHPSKETDLLTHKVKCACEVMGISLIEHILINSEGQYYSYADENRI